MAGLAVAGLYTSIGLSIGVFLAGFGYLVVGTLDLIRNHSVFSALHLGDEPHSNGLGYILEGLELLFLAPIVGLTFAGSSTFLRSQLYRLKALLDPNNVHALVDAKTEALATFNRQGKVGFVGFMIALLLTNLIRQVITGTVVDPWSLAGHAVGILMCLGYYLALLRLH